MMNFYMRWKKNSRNLKLASMPVIVVIGLIVFWHISVEYFKIPSYILPSPLKTIIAFWEAREILIKHSSITFAEAFLGFGIGTFVAFICAAFFVHIRSIRISCLPLAIIAQTIPILVYVPFVNIFFKFGISAKVFIAVIIAFFPALVNLVKGFESVDPLILDLMKTLDASWWDVFWKLRVPSSMPFLFASLKITSTLAMVGAMVGEWASGSFMGIGYLIQIYNSQIRTEFLLASVMWASIASVLFYGVISYIEKKLVTWL